MIFGINRIKAIGEEWVLIILNIIEYMSDIVQFVLYEGNDDRQNLLEKGTTSPDDMLLTFDLHGFEWCTLTDNISYNLLPCKQIHIITKDNLPDEKYLEKQLSISMFFCTDSKYYRYLLEKCPDIPYLKEFKGWKSSD